jgi:short-subunit dehydrogenase
MSTVVIVGAGPGLGLSLARAFGAKGFKVALVARNEGHLGSLNAALAEANIESRGFVADVTDESQIAAAFSQVRGAFDQIDVLIYNAGVIAPVSAAEATAELTRAHLEVNIIGAIASAQQVIPDMVERGKGAIFFTGGGASELTVTPVLTTLSIGKSGLRSYARCLHEELGDKGVYAGMVSIAGVIEAGTDFDPDTIAAEYVDMYDKRDTVERFFTGKA